MKAPLITALLLVYSAASSALTGEEFQRECSSDASYCHGYIQGVLDAQASWLFAYDRDPAHPKTKSRSVGKTLVQSEVEGLDLRSLPWIPTKHCSPSATTPEQAMRTTASYIAEHPDAGKYPADQVIAAALTAAYPCP